MANFSKYSGLIFRIHDSKEKDKVFNIMTKSGKRVTILAKNVKSSKSKKAASIEIGNIVLAKTIEGYAIPILTDINIQQEHREWKQDIESSLILQAICEVTARGTIDQDSLPDYSVLVGYLLKQAHQKRKYALLIAITSLLYYQGVLPNMSTCIHTNEKLKSDDVYVNLHEVGFLSSKSKSENRKLDPLTYKTIRFILESKRKDLLKLSASEETLKDALKIVIHWYELAFEVELKSKKVIYNILKF